jgi:hypothetical protein
MNLKKCPVCGGDKVFEVARGQSVMLVKKVDPALVALQRWVVLDCWCEGCKIRFQFE